MHFLRRRSKQKAAAAEDTEPPKTEVPTNSLKKLEVNESLPTELPSSPNETKPALPKRPSQQPLRQESQQASEQPPDQPTEQSPQQANLSPAFSDEKIFVEDDRSTGKEFASDKSGLSKEAFVDRSDPGMELVVDKPDVEEKLLARPSDPGKEALVDKPGIKKDIVYDEPDSENGTMSTLPPYSAGGSSIPQKTDSKSKSAGDIAKDPSALGPDINPVTSDVLVPSSSMSLVPYNPSALTKSPSSARSHRQTSLSYREYHFYYANTMTHLIICDPDYRALYFAEVSPFAKSMPDVCLRDILGGGFDDLADKGSNLGLKEASSASIIGVADSMPQSRHIKIGLGDPSEPEGQKWTLMRMVHEDLKAGDEEYDLTFTQPGQADRSYVWTRGSGGKSKSINTTVAQEEGGSSSEHFRMLGNNGIIASFRNAKMASLKKRGVLRVYDLAEAEDMLLITLVSIAALCERQRRRKVKRGLMLKF